jgi:hypothetical protein
VLQHEHEDHEAEQPERPEPYRRSPVERSADARSGQDGSVSSDDRQHRADGVRGDSAVKDGDEHISERVRGGKRQKQPSSIEEDGADEKQRSLQTECGVHHGFSWGCRDAEITDEVLRIAVVRKSRSRNSFEDQIRQRPDDPSDGCA